MRYRRLGRSGLMVSEIGLGGLFLANKDRETGIQIVQRALELGINFFDTAPQYQRGLSESILGEALAQQGRPDVHLDASDKEKVRRWQPIIPFRPLP